jgi:hypothetical protein
MLKLATLVVKVWKLTGFLFFDCFLILQKASHACRLSYQMQILLASRDLFVGQTASTSD